MALVLQEVKNNFVYFVKSRIPQGLEDGVEIPLSRSSEAPLQQPISERPFSISCRRTGDRIDLTGIVHPYNSKYVRGTDKVRLFPRDIISLVIKKEVITQIHQQEFVGTSNRDNPSPAEVAWQIYLESPTPQAILKDQEVIKTLSALTAKIRRGLAAK